MKSDMGLRFEPALVSASPSRDTWYPIQLENTATVATGAAVESTRYASFSRLIRCRSVTGLIALPTIRVFE